MYFGVLQNCPISTLLKNIRREMRERGSEVDRDPALAPTSWCRGPGSQRTRGFWHACVWYSLFCLCVPAVQLAHFRSVCQSVCRVRGHAQCIWILWADGRRAWLSHRCSTWLIDADPFEVFSGRMSSIHKLMHPPHSRPHLSLLSLHSVNSWNATLLRAYSGMKLRWTDSNIRDSLRIFSIYVELNAEFPALLIWIYCTVCNDMSMLTFTSQHGIYNCDCKHVRGAVLLIVIWHFCLKNTKRLICCQNN